MLELILDTCSDTLHVLLVSNEKLLDEMTTDVLSKHSVSLLPFIDTMLQRQKLTLSDINNYSVVVGAGSFTGIRIGVATIKAFCFALKRKTKSITSLQVLAYTISSEQNAIALCDAKQNKVYAQVFQRGQEITDIDVVELQNIQEYLQKYCDYPVYSNIEIKSANIKKVENLSEGLIRANKKARLISATELVPLYVRKPQAEEKLK